MYGILAKGVFLLYESVANGKVEWSIGRLLEWGCEGPLGHGIVLGRVEKAAKRRRC